ncbi:MAG: hypothetical protein EA406_05165 [Rhodospirillales bacterium]|nr:MAG: hypothetical protein EA406_05165 [Rhodospirillales bacterium]
MTDPTTGGAASDPIDARVARRLRQRRRSLGINTRLLDMLIGEQPGTVDRFETGQRRIGAAHLYRLSQVLQTDVGSFFEEDGITGDDKGGDGAAGPRSPDDPAFAGDGAPRLFSEAKRLAEEFARVTDPEVRATVLALIKTISETQRR